MKPIDDYFKSLSMDPSLLPAHILEANPSAKFSTAEMFEVRGKNEVRVSTNFFPMNEMFEIILICRKDIRSKTFRQKVVAVAGDPPDFFIKCVENCKEKLNRGQTLSLMIKCKNCARGRKPKFQWNFYLHDLIESEEDNDYFEDYGESEYEGEAQPQVSNIEEQF